MPGHGWPGKISVLQKDLLEHDDVNPGERKRDTNGTERILGLPEALEKEGSLDREAGAERKRDTGKVGTLSTHSVDNKDDGRGRHVSVLGQNRSRHRGVVAGQSQGGLHRRENPRTARMYRP
jgi:hypothetical protein